MATVVLYHLEIFALFLDKVLNICHYCIQGKKIICKGRKLLVSLGDELISGIFMVEQRLVQFLLCHWMMRFFLKESPCGSRGKWQVDRVLLGVLRSLDGISERAGHHARTHAQQKRTPVLSLPTRCLWFTDRFLLSRRLARYPLISRP